MVLSAGNGQNILRVLLFWKLHCDPPRQSIPCLFSFFFFFFLWACCPTMEELEPNSKVLKYVTQSAVNNLQGARLKASLLLKNAKDNSEVEICTNGRSSVVLGFCLRFHYSLYYNIWCPHPESNRRVEFSISRSSAHSLHCPAPRREPRRGHITEHESRENEMHSRCFQVVLIYGRGERIPKKKIKCNLTASFGLMRRWDILKIEQLQNRTDQWLHRI